MNKKEILKILDSCCYVIIFVATIFLLLFEFLGMFSILKCCIFLFEVEVILLAILLGIRIAYAYKKEENKDEEFVKTTFEKTFLIIRFILSILLFFWITFILFNF